MLLLFYLFTYYLYFGEANYFYGFGSTVFVSYFFFWGGVGTRSSGFVGVHIVECEFDFTSLGCSFYFYFYFYLLSTATDCTLIVYEGTDKSAYLCAFAFANAFYSSDCCKS